MISSRCLSTDSGSLPPLTRQSIGWGSYSTSIPFIPADGLPLHNSVFNTQKRLPMQPKNTGLPQDKYTFNPTARSNPLSIDDPDSYFPNVISQGSEETTPSGYRSTKELINRFESMTPSIVSLETESLRVPNMRRDHPLPELPLNRPLSSMKDRKRSPLKESFRNLIHLFAKKRGGKEDGSTLSSSPYNTPIPTPTVHSTPRSHCSFVPLETLELLHSGPLLYLSRPSVDSMLPVWISCKASLFSDRLVLEWHTAFGNPSSSIIALGKSSDVHSLSNTQVDQTERKLLPQDSQGAHMFEISYPGGPPEKFATTTVSERTAWVSCIWDALLQLGVTKDKITQINFTPKNDFQCIAASPIISSSGDDSQFRIETIRARTGRNPETAETLLQQVFVSEKTNENSNMAPCSPSEQYKLDQEKRPLPSVQNQVPMPIKKNNTQINRPATRLSRCSSVGSSYSVAQTQSGTPQPQFEENYPTIGGTKKGPRPKSAVSKTNYEDENSIYDFYTDKGFSGRVLSPVPDVSESGETPKLDDTLTQTSQRPTIFSNRKNSKKSTATTTYASCREEFDGNTTYLHPSNNAPSRQVSQRSNMSVSSDIVREDDSVHPLVALIQENAMKHCQQTSEIGNQITTLQDNVLGISAELRTTIKEQHLNYDGEMKSKLEDLCGRMEKATVTNSFNCTELRGLYQKLEGVMSQLKENKDDGAVMKTLKELEAIKVDPGNDKPPILDPLESLHKETTNNELNRLNTKLDEVLLILKREDVVQELRDVGKGKTTVNEKVDDDVSNKEGEPKIEPTAEDNKVANIESKFTEILDLLKSVSESKNLQAVQQTENARYLHELNTWLETFVNTGANQIQSVIKGIEQLQHELGVVSEEGAAPSGIKADLANLANSSRTGEEKISKLQEQLTVTVEMMKEKNAANKAIDMQTVIGMIETQKQEQETMLRNIAAELSNDIRGERLRFVEAMKEATAINVQVHVEEFKKELSREVMMMTCEVSRLQRERQMLEQQIADLFAFFAKQRAEMEQQQAERARQLQLPPSGVPPPRPAPHSRPLPVPQ